MYLYLNYPTDVLNMMIKYSPKELVYYLKDKDYNWGKLYYELFGEKEINIRYKYPKKYKNTYLNGIINRMSSKSDIVTYYNQCVRKSAMKISGFGNLFVKGNNSEGQLGLGRRKFVQSWTHVKLKHKVIQFANGYDYSMILLNNGKVFITGNNYLGKLGLGDDKDKCKWTEVQLEEKAVQIVCGISNFMILTTEGAIYISGLEVPGSLHTLHKVYFPEKIIQIASGYGHLIVLLETGVLFGVGRNNSSQLGCKEQITSCVDEWQEIYLPLRKNKEKVVQLQCGPSYTMVLLNDGRVFATGNNSLGNLGIGTNYDQNGFKELKIKNVIQIECKPSYSIIYLKDGHKLRTTSSGKWITNYQNN